MSGAMVLAAHRFGDADVAVVEHNGRQLWSSAQVSRALGYEHDHRIASLISREWSSELEEGTDYVILRGADLAAIKDAGLAGRRAAAFLGLTESGVHLVALLSRQPLSRALRRWFAEEVLPSIRRTGGYRAQPEAPQPRPDMYGAFLDSITAFVAQQRALAADFRAEGDAIGDALARMTLMHAANASAPSSWQAHLPPELAPPSPLERPLPTAPSADLPLVALARRLFGTETWFRASDLWEKGQHELELEDMDIGGLGSPARALGRRLAALARTKGVPLRAKRDRHDHILRYRVTA